MKTFNEVVEEMKASVSVTKNGKPKKTFSRADYDKLAQALLNEVDYCVETVGTKGGEKITTKTYPVKDIRAMFKKVLLDFGVDKQEAETIMTEYKFGNSSGLYGFNSATIVEYCKAGKKFDFPTEEEFKASLVINDVGETTKEYSTIRRIGDDSPIEKFKVNTKKHCTLKATSKPPKWLKERFK